MNTVTKSKKIGIDRSRIGQSDLGIPYLKMNNITVNGTLDLTSLTHIQCTEQEEKEYALEYGDIVFNTRNSYELVGKTAFWNGLVSNCVYNNNIMRIRTHDIISSKFLVYFMNSTQFRNSLLSIKRATTNICAIYDKDLKEQIIPIPPLNEQKRIVAKIEELFSLIENIEMNVSPKLPNLSTLRSSILKQAFEGKLIPQDPNDESASELLKRIELQK